MNEHSKNENPSLRAFETGRLERRDVRDKGAKKAQRVSQPRELAVVTLGAVASIAGLGGLLAANPPSWATTPENATRETAATAEANPGGAKQGDEEPQPRSTSADSNQASVDLVPARRQEEASEPPVEQASPPPPASSEASRRGGSAGLASLASSS